MALATPRAYLTTFFGTRALGFLPAYARWSRERGHRDLDVGTGRKLGDLDSCAARRVLGEILGVDGVHLGEVVQVREVDECLDRQVQTRTGRLQDRLDVLQRPSCLGFNPPEHDLPRRGIDTLLARHEDETASFDSLRVGTHGLARFVCCNNLNAIPGHIYHPVVPLLGLRAPCRDRVITRTQALVPEQNYEDGETGSFCRCQLEDALVHVED